MRLRRRLTRITGVALVFAGMVAGLSLLFPPDLSRYRATSTEIRARDGSLLNVFETHDGHWRLRTDVADVDPRYISMLCTYEDKRFYEHLGVDPLAMVRAAGQWMASGHIVSGGSTLTMQVARLLEPHRKYLGGKLFEMIRAMQLEARFSKTEILDMYLTLAPFGGNLEGVRAASLAYFGKEPGELSAAQSALLVALPQSPTRRRPDRHPEAALAARSKVLSLVATLRPDLANPVQDDEAAMPTGRQAFPALAPYFSRRLAHDANGEVIASTIDPVIQARVEALMREETANLDPHAGMAIMVVDNHTHAVLASVGGRGLSTPGGYVDMTTALRSPGSTLKPFIYGLAFDDLAIHPETLIQDTAMHFADYAPRDFDGQFHGLVTVREALQQSLNIPAIAVMQRVGPGRLTAALDGVGVHLKLPEATSDPGLAIALGGAGISLHGLVTLYEGLADGGKISPLVERSDSGAPVAPQTLLSPVAVYYLTTILRGSPMPDGLAPTALTAEGGRIAWKTGTSYGFRDAWALGYSPSFTVGIWVGRVEGTPRPGAYGRNTAAPIMFKVFDILPHSSGTEDLKPPPGVILATANMDLPLGLRMFQPHRTQEMSGPRIVYPPAASTIDLVHDAKGGWEAIQLATAGGTGPLRFFVNGQPLPPDADRQFLWKPDGPGFATVIAIDDRDRRAVSQFRLVPAP